MKNGLKAIRLLVNLRKKLVPFSHYIKTIKFIVKHDLEGGFDFHGFFIPVLNVTEQVTRHEPKIVEVMVPKNLKAGEYPIGCQFHPKHVKATLVVKKENKEKK